MAEKIRILNDFVYIVALGSDTKVKKFFFAATPKNLNEDEGKNWDGKISAIKSLIENGLDEQRSIFGKKFSMIQRELLESSGKVSALNQKSRNIDDKVDNLHNMTRTQFKLIFEKLEEINAGEIQKFTSFYQNKLKVILMKTIGELKVCDM